MKKDKNETEENLNPHRKYFSFSFKNILISVFFVFLFISTIYILGSQKKKFFPQEPEISADPHLAAQSPLSFVPEWPPLPSLLAKKESEQSELLHNLERTVNLTTQLSHRLVTLEILKEALEGHVSLDTFSLYLKNHPEPWTEEILRRLGDIPKVLTYEQLQALLIPPPSSKTRTHFLWRKIKSIIKSFVHIRKLNQEDKNRDKIQEALRMHNVKQAIEIFYRTIPPEQYIHYNEWLEAAMQRYTLEEIQKKMLLSIAEN